MIQEILGIRGVGGSGRGVGGSGDWDSVTNQTKILYFGLLLGMENSKLRIILGFS